MIAKLQKIFKSSLPIFNFFLGKRISRSGLTFHAFFKKKNLFRNLETSTVIYLFFQKTQIISTIRQRYCERQLITPILLGFIMQFPEINHIYRKNAQTPDLKNQLEPRLK